MLFNIKCSRSVKTRPFYAFPAAILSRSCFRRALSVSRRFPPFHHSNIPPFQTLGSGDKNLNCSKASDEDEAVFRVVRVARSPWNGETPDEALFLFVH
jgi:hypothetical protein